MVVTSTRKPRTEIKENVKCTDKDSDDTNNTFERGPEVVQKQQFLGLEMVKIVRGGFP